MGLKNVDPETKNIIEGTCMVLAMGTTAYAAHNLYQSISINNRDNTLEVMDIGVDEMNYSEKVMRSPRVSLGNILPQGLEVTENVKRLKECCEVQIDIDRNGSSQRKSNIRGTAENISECKKKPIFLKFIYFRYFIFCILTGYNKWFICFKTRKIMIHNDFYVDFEYI